MPKAKPVWLWPLSFDAALKKAIGAPPAMLIKSEKHRRQHRPTSATHTS